MYIYTQHMYVFIYVYIHIYIYIYCSITVTQDVDHEEHLAVLCVCMLGQRFQKFLHSWQTVDILATYGLERILGMPMCASKSTATDLMPFTQRPTHTLQVLRNHHMSLGIVVLSVRLS